MGGSSIEDDWDFPSLLNGARTLLLVGHTGNGKSATGNSIIGRKVFKSKKSFRGVTSTTEMQSTTLNDGQVINVIDTIGLFDPLLNSGVIGKEVVKSIELAKDGIHAIVLVLSVRTRFTKSEAKSLDILKSFFGPKIADYMIVVFTGGDELQENGETLDDFLAEESLESLQDILETCKNRCVLFNNITKDEEIMANQTQQLLDYVETIMQENEGRPYSDSLFKELRKGAMKLREQEKHVESLEGYSTQEISDLKEQMHKSHEDQLKRITEMVESKLSETTKMLEEQLAEEHAARLRAEEMAQVAMGKSNDEIRKLRENLERAHKETEELRKAAASGKCAIL